MPWHTDQLFQVNVRVSYIPSSCAGWRHSNLYVLLPPFTQTTAPWEVIPARDKSSLYVLVPSLTHDRQTPRPFLPTSEQAISDASSSSTIRIETLVDTYPSLCFWIEQHYTFRKGVRRGGGRERTAVSHLFAFPHGPHLHVVKKAKMANPAKKK